MDGIEYFTSLVGRLYASRQHWKHKAKVAERKRRQSNRYHLDIIVRRNAERDDARRHACRLMWERDEAQLLLNKIGELEPEIIEDAVWAIKKEKQPCRWCDKDPHHRGWRHCAHYVVSQREWFEEWDGWYEPCPWCNDGGTKGRPKREATAYDPHEAASIGYEVDRGGDDD